MPENQALYMKKEEPCVTMTPLFPFRSLTRFQLLTTAVLENERFVGSSLTSVVQFLFTFISILRCLEIEQGFLEFADIARRWQAWGAHPILVSGPLRKCGTGVRPSDAGPDSGNSASVVGGHPRGRRLRPRSFDNRRHTSQIVLDRNGTGSVDPECRGGRVSDSLGGRSASLRTYLRPGTPATANPDFRSHRLKDI